MADSSPVPERTVVNEYGQSIVVRVAAGIIKVKHEGIPEAGFFEYIPPETPVSLPSSDESQFDLPGSAPSIFGGPKREREFLKRVVPDDSPQHNLTIDEKRLIEETASDLLGGDGWIKGWYMDGG